jgi:hypothetical protein
MIVCVVSIDRDPPSTATDQVAAETGTEPCALRPPKCKLSRDFVSK